MGVNNTHMMTQGQKKIPMDSTQGFSLLTARLHSSWCMFTITCCTFTLTSVHVYGPRFAKKKKECLVVGVGVYGSVGVRMGVSVGGRMGGDRPKKSKKTKNG